MLSRWNKNHLNFKVEKLILDPWASGTKKQYKIYFKQKTTFCKTQTVDFSNASIKDGTELLRSLHKKGLGYSAINATRSMPSNVLPVKEGIEFGKHPIVTRMLKGIFTTRPKLPQYIYIYDAEIVIEFLKSLPCWEEMAS